MSWLKKLPIDYYGELHEVKLVQFSVDMDEIKQMVPNELKIRSFNGRAMISMVNVKLKHMHPGFAHKCLGFSYRHVAFRLLLDDGTYNMNGEQKGIYFLKSFTNKPLVAYSGNIMTNYNLSVANIQDKNNMFELKQGDKYMHYAFEPGKPEHRNEELKAEIARIDRAYCVLSEDVHVTQVERKGWPIEWVDCYHFETNFFKSARFEAAFAIEDPVKYHWLAAKNVG